MTNKVISYSIVTSGVDSCSGNCKYCSAASSMNYTMSIKGLRDDVINYDLIKSEVKRVIEANEQEMVLDFPALEKALDNDIKNVKHIDDTNGYVFKADLWGADGLNNFIALQEETYFLEDYCKNRGMKCLLHTSTNGLPLVLDEIYDFCKQHNIHIQLSHDGCGQHLRTEKLDPLDIPNVRKAIREGYLDWINCTLTFWNWSLFDNIRYFNDKLTEIFPEVFDPNKTCSPEIDKIYRSLFIKLNHIYNGDYDIKAINKFGIYRGKSFDQLKTEPYGNLALRNDYELADKLNMPELAHVLDEYIHEWYQIRYILKKADRNNNAYYMPFRSYLEGQMKRFKELPHDDRRHILSGACHSFQTNRNFDSKLGRSTTFVIDTEGEYSECNLIDHHHHVGNPTAQQPDYCKNCKYRFQHECTSCGSVQYPKKCEYQYRWVQFLETCYWEDESNNIKKKGHICNAQNYEPYTAKAND